MARKKKKNKDGKYKNKNMTNKERTTNEIGHEKKKLKIVQL